MIWNLPLFMSQQEVSEQKYLGHPFRIRTWFSPSFFRPCTAQPLTAHEFQLKAKLNYHQNLPHSGTSATLYDSALTSASHKPGKSVCNKLNQKKHHNTVTKQKNSTKIHSHPIKHYSKFAEYYIL